MVWENHPQPKPPFPEFGKAISPFTPRPQWIYLTTSLYQKGLLGGEGHFRVLSCCQEPGEHNRLHLDKGKLSDAFKS